MLYVYTYKTSYSRGRPNWAWVRRSRWLFLRWEDGERFKNVLATLERWKVPMVAVGRENRVKGYLVLKVEDVREFLAIVGADLLYDAYITNERVKCLEDLGWDVEVYKPTPKLLALWKVGLESGVKSKITEVREKFQAVLRVLNEGVLNEKGNVEG